MADYIDLFTLEADFPVEAQALRNKIEIAISIKAQAQLDDAALSDFQRAWASRVLLNPRGVMPAIYNYLIGAVQEESPNITIPDILNAPDSAIQARTGTAMDSAIAAVTQNTQNTAAQ